MEGAIQPYVDRMSAAEENSEIICTILYEMKADHALHSSLSVHPLHDCVNQQLDDWLAALDQQTMNDPIALIKPFL